MASAARRAAAESLTLLQAPISSSIVLQWNGQVLDDRSAAWQ
jgi:hypothetical protein